MQSKADFRRAMQCGLGSCNLTLAQTGTPEHYRKIVLWGCLHQLSYDPQCEGTRAFYLYTLVAHYQDDAYFVEPLIQAFSAQKTVNLWRFSQNCDLLYLFAENRSKVAAAALSEKYDTLYAALKKKRKKAMWLCEAFDALCATCLSSAGITGFRRIADDIARLTEENTQYDGTEFLWFFCHAKSVFGRKRLEACIAAKRTPQRIRTLYQRISTCLCHVEVSPTATPQQITAEMLIAGAKTDTLTPSQRRRFLSQATATDLKVVAHAVLTEATEQVQATLLWVFRRHAFPLPCEPLLIAAQSDHPALREAALNALTNCRADCVRHFALALLQSGTDTGAALCMLLTNYRHADKEVLLLQLYKPHGDWHAVILHLLRLLDAGNPARLPKEFLYYIYETSRCARCRESAIHHLRARGALPPKLLQECCYDSNDDIRRYALASVWRLEQRQRKKHDYYPVAFRLHEQTKWAIWYSDTTDGFLTDLFCPPVVCRDGCRRTVCANDTALTAPAGCLL